MKIHHNLIILSIFENLPTLNNKKFVREKNNQSNEQSNKKNTVALTVVNFHRSKTLILLFCVRSIHWRTKLPKNVFPFVSI